MMRKKEAPLSQGEIQGFKEERSELESQLREAQEYGQGTGREINQDLLKNQIKKLDNTIQKNAQLLRTTPRERDEMAKEAEALEEKFQRGMPTRFEMNHPARCPGAVKKHMTWLQNNQNTGDVERYRTIQRRLNPGEERSIESLRKDK